MRIQIEQMNRHGGECMEASLDCFNFLSGVGRKSKSLK